MPAHIAKEIERKLLGENPSEGLELFPEDENASDVSIERLAQLYKISRARRRTVRPDSVSTFDLAEFRQELEKLLLENEEPRIALDASITRSVAESTSYIHQFFVASERANLESLLGRLQD